MLYSKLYGVESYYKEMRLSFDQRKEIRQEKSVPVFNVADWIKEVVRRLTTLRSPIGKVMAYFMNKKSS
jgi:transposase